MNDINDKENYRIPSIYPNKPPVGIAAFCWMYPYSKDRYRVVDWKNLTQEEKQQWIDELERVETNLASRRD